MNKSEFEKQKQAIWFRFERVIGHPVDPALRRLVENLLVDPDCSQEYRGFLKDLPGVIEDRLPQLQHLVERMSNPPKPQHSDQPSHVRYQKCFDRRLHIVEFVADKGRLITLNHMIDRSFKPHRRIKWDKILRAWNEAHPYDQFSKSEVLRVQFSRALRETRLVETYFDRIEEETRGALAPLSAHFAGFMQYMEVQRKGLGDAISEYVKVYGEANREEYERIRSRKRRTK